MRYDLACAHEIDSVPVDEEVSDFHPLSYDEVVVLLKTAQRSQDGLETSSIQVRLKQAIPGQVCPRKLPEEDEALAQKTIWREEQYIAHRTAGDLPEMAGQFYALMRD